MRVRELQTLLDAFDSESEIGVEIGFPEIDYMVKTYDFAWGYDRDYEGDEGFQLTLSIYGTDFDYPAILRRVKDAVAAIPEENCSPK